jgi:hypothetical protein
MTDQESLLLCEPQPFAFSGNSQIYHYKDRTKVFKMNGRTREFEIMLAAGDCAVTVYEKVIGPTYGGDGDGMTGFALKRETPFDVKAIEPAQRRTLMQGMISVVHELHSKAPCTAISSLRTRLSAPTGRFDFATSLRRGGCMKTLLNGKV